MKLLYGTVISCFILAGVAGKDCDQFIDKCSSIGDLGNIECTQDPPEPQPTKTPTDPPAPTDHPTEKPTEKPPTEFHFAGETCTGFPDGLTGTEEIEVMDFSTCRKLCRQTPTCEFYKFDYDHTEGKAHCYLQSECNGEGVGDCLDPNYCRSGQVDCYEDGTEIKPCELTTSTEYHPGEFHIICTDEDLGDINPYFGEEKASLTVHGDTICETVRMCDAWNDQANVNDVYWRKAAIKCNGGKDEGTPGEWIAMSNTGSKSASAEMIGTNEQLHEPKCGTRCEDLKLTKFSEQYWADLICDPPLETPYILKDIEGRTDSCYLLCDNHLKMTIDCTFMGNGEKYWNNNHGTVLADDDVICDP